VLFVGGDQTQFLILCAPRLLPQLLEMEFNSFSRFLD
jgi:hypothetical protein